jgi:hypothetical protein
MNSPQHTWSGKSLPIEMTSERFLDADEPDAKGNHMFYYAGVWYAFERDGRKASARRYDDHPDEVSINGFWPTRKQPPLRSRPLAYIPYHDPFLAGVVSRILQEPGVRSVSFLCRDGYRDIDLHLLWVRQRWSRRIPAWFWLNSWWLVLLIFAAGLGRLLALLLPQ